MKRNTNIRVTKKRSGVPLGLFVIYQYALYFRLILETFIRKDFGKRYYSLRHALLVAFFMLLWVILLEMRVFQWIYLFIFESQTAQPEPDPSFWFHYGSWCGFIILFLICAVVRKIEAMRNYRFTESLGSIHPLFFKIKLFGQPVTSRFVETIAEPVFCFAVGFLFHKCEQAIGLLMMVSSVFYSLSYIYAYWAASDQLDDENDADIQSNLPDNSGDVGKIVSHKSTDAEDVL